MEFLIFKSYFQKNCAFSFEAVQCCHSMRLVKKTEELSVIKFDRPSFRMFGKIILIFFLICDQTKTTETPTTKERMSTRIHGSIHHTKILSHRRRKKDLFINSNRHDSKIPNYRRQKYALSQSFVEDKGFLSQIQTCHHRFVHHANKNKMWQQIMDSSIT